MFSLPLKSPSYLHKKQVSIQRGCHVAMRDGKPGTSEGLCIFKFSGWSPEEGEEERVAAVSWKTISIQPDLTDFVQESSQQHKSSPKKRKPQNWDK